MEWKLQALETRTKVNNQIHNPVNIRTICTTNPVTRNEIRAEEKREREKK
jgi:hypothetical protein